MKKTAFLIALGLLFAASAKVSALNVSVQPNGTMVFYDDVVLGKNTETERGPKERQEVKRVMPWEKKSVTLQPESSGVKVTLESTDDLNINDIGDEMDASRVTMEVPSALTEGQLDAAQEKMQEEKKVINQQTKEYMERLREERRQRLEEMYAVKNRLNDEGKSELELESRGSRAALNGARFTYDPEAGEVTLTTPSGNIHVLNHLPDQAIIQMQKLAQTPISTEAASLEVETDEDGDLTYTAKVKKQKKLFGLLPQEVEAEITLDDATGEVIEEEVEPEGFFSRLLSPFLF